MPSYLHPHDLLEGLKGVIAYGRCELGLDVRLFGGHHVIGNVGQASRGRLGGEVVGVGLARLHPVDGISEDVGETVPGAARSGSRRLAPSKLANGQQIDISEHALLVSSAVRLARQLGINRVMRNVTPSLNQYLATRRQSEAQE